ncbi:MAG: DUF2232 domain-containing protein [Clostridium sp.]
MSNQKDTKALVTSAMLVALTVVIFALGRFLPVVDLIAMFVAHIPIVVIYLKYGPKYALTGAAAATAIISISLGIVQGMSFITLSGVIGVILGFCISKKYNTVVTIIVLGMSNLVLFGLFIKISQVITGVDLISNYIDLTIGMFEQNINVLKGAGVPVDMIPYGNNLSEVRDLIGLAFPGFMIIGSAASGIIWYSLTQKVLIRLKINIEPIRRFSTWFIPSKVAFPVMILVLINMFTGGEELDPFGFAIRLVFVVLFVVNGLAVIAYYLIDAKFKPGVAGLISGVVLLLLPNILVFVGLFEYAFNFRGLDSNRRKLLGKK